MLSLGLSTRLYEAGEYFGRDTWAGAIGAVIKGMDKSGLPRKVILLVAPGVTFRYKNMRPQVADSPTGVCEQPVWTSSQRLRAQKLGPCVCVWKRALDCHLGNRLSCFPSKK